METTLIRGLRDPCFTKISPSEDFPAADIDIDLYRFKFFSSEVGLNEKSKLLTKMTFYGLHTKSSDKLNQVIEILIQGLKENFQLQRSIRRSLLKILVFQGEDVLVSLIDHLDEYIWVVRNLQEVLGKTKKVFLYQLTKSAINHPSWKVRHNLAMILLDHGDR